MKKNLFYILHFVLINQVILYLSKEKREELLNKYAKEIKEDSINSTSNLRNLKNKLRNLEYNIDYDFKQIKKLIEKNQFPSSYNFLKDPELKPKTLLKNQGLCGSCWAMSTTTAFAYRYHRIEKYVDFSPQYAVSCYAENCEGINRINAQLNLVKNGVVSESCFKYSSQEGNVAICPTKCSNNKELFKLYKAQKAYILENFSKNEYYDVVTLIIDQITKEGPVSASIPVYEDFRLLFNSIICTNDYIYNHNEKSVLLGYHNVVIVGYGFLKNKYYWIVQNSWGEKFCDKGFVKIEFGQIHIEKISFVYPLISEAQELKDIKVKLDSLNSELCEIKVSAISSLDDWEDTLEITFQNTHEFSDEINYLCNVNENLKKKKNIKCYFDLHKKKNEGTYIYKSFKSLGNRNNFSLDNSFEDKFFKYYGTQNFLPVFYIDNYNYNLNSTKKYYYYVSDKKSSIFLLKNPNIEKLDPLISTINANGNKLKKCKEHIIETGESIIKCELNSDEIQYFNDFPTEIKYTCMCGQQNCHTYVYVSKLDREKYPVFKIIKVDDKNDYPSFKKILYISLLVDIEGSLTDFQNNNDNDNQFEILINIEGDNQTFIISQMNCSIHNPLELTKNNIVNCKVYNNNLKEINKIIIYPYYWIINQKSPFEIIFNSDIVNSSSNYYNFYLVIIMCILLL